MCVSIRAPSSLESTNGINKRWKNSPNGHTRNKRINWREERDRREGGRERERGRETFNKPIPLMHYLTSTTKNMTVTSAAATLSKCGSTNIPDMYTVRANRWYHFLIHREEGLGEGCGHY